MSSSIVWQGTIADDSGGTLYHKLHDNETTVNNTNRYVYCGFSCQRGNYIPLMSDNYEATNYQGFMRFSIPSSADPINSVTLYLWYYGGNLVEANNLLDYVDIQIWARQSYSVTKFPWQTLDTDDYSNGWTQVGTLGNARTFFNGSQGWKSIDVTSVFQAAVAAGWSVFAIRLIPSYIAPSDWDYNNIPFIGWGTWTSVNEACYAAFCGQGAQDVTGILPGTYGSDTGYDWIYTRPWLKIDYDTVTPPTPTPATVNVVAGDPKAKVCLAGTSSGSLWKIFKSSSGWQAGKSHNFGGEVTAIYIDSIRNFKDYPTTALAWVGASGGNLYKSYGLRNWSLISSGQWGVNPFIEIRGSDVDSDKVVVAAGYAIYTTNNGGLTWRQALIKGSYVTGLYVKGNEIQVLFGSAGGFRSPDFGATWYSMLGEPSSSVDVAFSKNSEKRSVIAAGSNLYKYSSGITEFTYAAGASIAGTPKVIDADPEDELMIVGTTSNLYQTADWGATTNILKSGVNVKSASLGGGYLYNP